MFWLCFEVDFGIVVVAQAKTLKWIYSLPIYCFMFDTVGVLACYSVKSLKLKSFRGDWSVAARAYSGVIREFKLHLYGKRQTSDSSWEFLKIENEHIKNSSKQFLWMKNYVKLLI